MHYVTNHKIDVHKLWNRQRTRADHSIYITFNIKYVYIYTFTAIVTAYLQYNHQYNSAENKSNCLDDLSLAFVITRRGRTSS